MKGQKTTAEEFYREKIKENYNYKQGLAMIFMDINAEKAMRWAKEFSDLQTAEKQKEIDLLKEAFNGLKQIIDNTEDPTLKDVYALKKEIEELKDNNLYSKDIIAEAMSTAWSKGFENRGAFREEWKLETSKENTIDNYLKSLK